MSIIDVYERAHHRLEMEKEAQAVVDYYGTCDGYLPEAYFGAFMELEKEAHVENMVNTFAPETGYIPSAYVNVLEKEANFFSQGMASLGTNLVKGVKGVGVKGGKMTLNNPNTASFLDKARVAGGNLAYSMGRNPGTTALAGGSVAGAYGLGRYR